MVLLHISADRFLFLGLELMGFRPKEPIARTKQNLARFLGCFGTTPEAASAIFSDLQTTTIEKAVVEGINFKHFMMTLNWLKSYKIEHELAAAFHLHEDTVRKWTWFYTRKIQALKEVKIRWDVLENAPETYLITDDGVHFRVGEPRNQPSTKWSSKKFGKKAALTYEVAIAIRHNQVVLLNGPEPGAAHDMTMFNSDTGAGRKLPAGKMAVTDRLYSGPADCEKKRVRHG